MLKAIDIKEIGIVGIQNQYRLGERNFPRQQLRRINLQNVDLQNINLQGSDLSYADLKGANLKGANLSHCYFREANLTDTDLTNADLTGAYFTKAYLTRANCQRAILKQAHFTESFLTKANLSQTDLSGSCFHNSYLTGTIFKDACYSSETIFNKGIKPEELGMVKDSLFSSSQTHKISIAEIITDWEAIAQITSEYLGTKITIKNFEQSRPDHEWLNNFSLNDQCKICYQGSVNDKLTSSQVKLIKKWTKSFVKISSRLVCYLPKILEEKKLTLDTK